jgi:hypothetical protein
MKTICRCGRIVEYHEPLDDFHVERVACNTSCVKAQSMNFEQPFTTRLFQSDIKPQKILLLRKVG